VSQHTTLTPAVLLFVSTLQVAPTPSWSHSFLAGRLQTDHFMMILGSSKNQFHRFSSPFPIFFLFFQRASLVNHLDDFSGKQPATGWTLLPIEQNHVFLATKTTNNWLKLQPNLEPLIPYQQRHLWIDDDDFCQFPKAGGILLMLQKSGALTTWDVYKTKKPISWDMVYQTSTGVVQPFGSPDFFRKKYQQLAWESSWTYCWWFRNPKQPPGMYKTL